MEALVDALSSAYEEFVASAAGVLEAKEASGGQKTVATDAALEDFKQRWELFRVACDHAEEFVESAKQRIGSECLVDEATGLTAAAAPGKPGQVVGGGHGLPPISAVRLEQMSKAVRWLVIELQHGPGAAGASHPHASPPFDARFSEDAAQLGKDEEDFWTKVIKCRYFSSSRVWDLAPPPHHRTSPLWRGIFSCGDLIASGVRVELGDDQKCRFVKYRWCGDFILESLLPSLFALIMDPMAFVAQAFDEHLLGVAWAPTFRCHFLLEKEE
ncbi:hypothetical protein Taro_049254 [Colocasia esculenta]|uniref:Mediator of RNA polymerase II transcription subunit 32 n=1 Tax=Colocasia esculenta TaxID=4460 RepID=A0A843XAG4_COLES|nr:hypothetical protein [Colocasia esculenta]